MFCRYCGAELTGPFCARCGNPAGEPVDPAPSPAATQPAQPEPPARGEAFWNPAESMRSAERSAPSVSFAAPNTPPETVYTRPAPAAAPADPFAGTDCVGDFEDPDDTAFLFDAAPAAGVPDGTPAGEPSAEIPKEKKKEKKNRKDRKKEAGRSAKEAPQPEQESRKKAAKNEKDRNLPLPANSGSPTGESGRAKKPLRFASVFPAVFALFFPAAYFFFDLFVVYGDALSRKIADGLTALHQFIDRATSPAYDANSAAELMSGTFGESAGLLSPLSLGTLSETTAYLLPVVTTLVAAALSVLAGVLILLSGARILRCRVFLDLMTLAGLAAAFAPFLGETVYLVLLYLQTQSFAAVNRTMSAFGVSVESMLLMCICALFLIPALRKLRRVGDRAAGRDYPVILPCAALGAKFFPAKLFTLIALAFCLVFPVLFLIGPVYSPELSLADWSATELLTKTGEALRAVISGGDSVNTWMTFLLLFAEILLALQVPFLAIACVPLLVQFIRVVFTGKHIGAKAADKEKRRTAGDTTAGFARGALMLPFVSFAIFGVLATLLMLFASHIAIHLDFSDPDGTLNTVYLVIAYIKSLGGTTCAYALLMTVGAPLWHLAGNFHNAMTSHRVPKASDA